MTGSGQLERDISTILGLDPADASAPTPTRERTRVLPVVSLLVLVAGGAALLLLRPGTPPAGMRAALPSATVPIAPPVAEPARIAIAPLESVRAAPIDPPQPAARVIATRVDATRRRVHEKPDPAPRREEVASDRAIPAAVPAPPEPLRPEEALAANTARAPVIAPPSLPIDTPPAESRAEPQDDGRAVRQSLDALRLLRRQ